MRSSSLGMPCSCSRSISRWTSARSRASCSRRSSATQSAGTVPAVPAGRLSPPRGRLPEFRRSSKVCGKASAGHPCRDRACSRMARSPARSSPSSSSSASAPKPGCRDREPGPRSGRARRFYLAERGHVTLARPTVCFWTAAFRISARTTSSVIRALCASRSANWSRAAASGIRAATVSIRVRNSRRLSSLWKSCSDGRPVEQVLEIRPGLPQLFLVRGAAVLPDELIGIVPGRQHGHVDLEPLGDQQLRRPGGRPLAGGVGIEAEDDLRRETFQQPRLCRVSAPCRTRRPRS